jgi:hypothetical protein
MLGDGYSWDSLEVGNEFNVFETRRGEQIGDWLRLAVADFEGDEAAGDETAEGLGDEAAVDVETVGTGEKGEGGFVVADFDGEGRAIGFWDVGWVGDYDVELLFIYWGEKVALEEADAIGEASKVGVATGNSERCFRGIDCGDLGVWPVMRECNCNCAGAGAYID